MTHPAVTVYSKKPCVQCDATFRSLDKKDVTYTVVDIGTDTTALNYVRSLGHMQAPVVVVETGTEPVHWSGFNPHLINFHFGESQVA
ncbi:NrdH-redoxin [Arthrobacter frigidicola]|nr:NrdH-redoxin [Arthrobacter frigidicola]